MALKYSHPSVLLSEITSDQVTDWMAYDKVEPFGHDTLYFMIARVCSLLYNINRKKGTAQKNPWDFIPFIKGDPSERKQSTETMKELLMGLVKESDPDRKSRVKRKGGKTKLQKKRERKLKEVRLRRKVNG